MFQSLAKILRGPSWQGARQTPGEPDPADTIEEMSPLEMLATTDELRAALFPKTGKLVSTIFDRPVANRPATSAGPEQAIPPQPVTLAAGACEDNDPSPLV